MKMSLAKMCDRCGRLYEPKNAVFKRERFNGIVLIDRKSTNESHFNRYVFDLCPECLNAFWVGCNWMRRNITMIKLNAHEYCHDCLEFEPQVVQRPGQFSSLSGDFGVLGDTIVECEHMQLCESLYNRLKKENDNADC